MTTRAHTYRGLPVPRCLPVPFYEGWRDSDFRRFDQLYRKPTWKRVAYWLGWTLARLSRDRR